MNLLTKHQLLNNKRRGIEQFEEKYPGCVKCKTPEGSQSLFTQSERQNIWSTFMSGGIEYVILK